MRRALPLLLFAAAVAAEDAFDEASKAVEAARGQMLAPDARAIVLPAVEKMALCDDPRAASSLAGLVLAGVASEEEGLARKQDLQAKGAEARTRMEDVDRELMMLMGRKQAGAKGLEPAITERQAERARLEVLSDTARAEVLRLDVRVGTVRELRMSIVASLAGLLGRLPADKLPAALDAVQAEFANASREAVLLQARALRDSGRREATPQLLTLLDRAADDLAMRKVIASALAHLAAPEGVRALLALWENEPEAMGAHVRHLLGLVASRPLPDLDAARAWARTYEG